MTSSMTLNRHKIYKYVIIASLNSESACKLINRIPGYADRGVSKLKHPKLVNTKKVGGDLGRRFGTSKMHLSSPLA